MGRAGYHAPRAVRNAVCACHDSVSRDQHYTIG